MDMGAVKIPKSEPKRAHGSLSTPGKKLHLHTQVSLFRAGPAIFFCRHKYQTLNE